MTNITCLTTPTKVLGPHLVLGTTRSVYLTNNSTTESIWLFFGDGKQSDLSPTTPFGYQLAKGASLVLAAMSVGGRDGCDAIWGCSVSGTALLTVQVIQGTKTLP
jgi:hypothetical protein